MHPSTTIEEIANNVRAGGLVESINYRPEKRVCFITFIDPNIAYKFFMSHQVLHQLLFMAMKSLLDGQINPVGHYHVTLESLSVQVQQEMYILGSKLLIAVLLIRLKVTKIPLPSEKELREDFGKFGPLEQINFIHNRESGFMNFLRIADAIKVVSILNMVLPLV